MNDEPARAGASLSAGTDCTEDQGGENRLKVSARRDDDGIVTAQFEQ